MNLQINWRYFTYVDGKEIPDTEAYHNALERSDTHFAQAMWFSATGWLTALVASIWAIGGIYTPFIFVSGIIAMWSMLVLLSSHAIHKYIEVSKLTTEFCEFIWKRRNKK